MISRRRYSTSGASSCPTSAERLGTPALSATMRTISGRTCPSCVAACDAGTMGSPLFTTALFVAAAVRSRVASRLRLAPPPFTRGALMDPQCGSRTQKSWYATPCWVRILLTTSHVRINMCALSLIHALTHPDPSQRTPNHRQESMRAKATSRSCDVCTRNGLISWTDENWSWARSAAFSPLPARGVMDGTSGGHETAGEDMSGNAEVMLAQAHARAHLTASPPVVVDDGGASSAPGGAQQGDGNETDPEDMVCARSASIQASYYCEHQAHTGPNNDPARASRRGADGAQVAADSDAEKSESSGRSAWESSDDEEEMLGSVLGSGQVLHKHVPSRYACDLALQPRRARAGWRSAEISTRHSVFGSYATKRGGPRREVDSLRLFHTSHFFTTMADPIPALVIGQ
jgi:hypothetical protein